MDLNEMKEMCLKVQEQLNKRYGSDEGQKIRNATCKQYNHYLKEIPDYGGKKNAHALAIYGSIIIFSLYPLLPDHPPVEELQEFVTHLFMGPFEKLGKIFNLNRSFDIGLIDKVFHIVGHKD